MVKHEILVYTMSDNFVISKIIQKKSSSKTSIYGEFDPGSE